ncbi:MAG: cohesin domain-containing protein [Patescibacteria group bacterium]
MKKLFSLLGIMSLSILFIFGAWILIHMLAVFGIFVAVAYLLSWFFAPKYIPCLFCRVGKEGAMCPLCHRTIVKKTNLSPEHVTSAVLNSALIFLFSIFSLGIVFGESRILSLFGFSDVPKTASFTIPTKGQYKIGEIFPMEITIKNITHSINAVQADVAFDPKKVEIVDIVTKESFATIFIQKEINNDTGLARLTGGLPNPGFIENEGVFGTILFRAKSAGIVNISFLASSMALANDGKAINVLKDLPSASYLILPEQLSEAERKKQARLLVENSVLGAKTEKNPQLTFYDTKERIELYTEKDIQKYESRKVTIQFLDTLQDSNLLILNLWRTLLNLGSQTDG